ncbi:GSCOCG00011561001-RA-CDS, partial [Cotesia congregata]
MEVIVAGCDAAMPRRSAGSRRKPVYWWTAEIALLRAECLRLRRQALRSRKRDTGQQKNEEYKVAKKQLVTEIKASKGRCWEAICREVDDDLWGNGDWIVTR